MDGGCEHLWAEVHAATIARKDRDSWDVGTGDIASAADPVVDVPHSDQAHSEASDDIPGWNSHRENDRPEAKWWLSDPWPELASDPRTSRKVAVKRNLR